MKNLIQFIILSIVDKPDEFKLTEEKTESGFINYLVKLAPEDMGKVIGKKGKIIRAIRNLIRTKAFREGQKVIFTLEEDQDFQPTPEKTPDF
ncbi:MAG TPA: KH domain-containing protein [Candidatus Bathyarchaeia archaeon]|nr:KH domain-containing protein [Candidatus Bathyarchaeia archaeon]